MKNKNTLGKAIVTAILVPLIVLYWYNIFADYSHCSSLGRDYVRGLFWFKCI